jgi:hypothetical protein
MEFAFSKDHKVSKYSIAFKEDLLFISVGQSELVCFRSAGGRIGVGCKNDEVLQMRADYLVYDNMPAVISRHSFCCVHFP